MSARNLAQHLLERPYVELEIDDYDDLKHTKAQLDKARQEVEKRYENLSMCHLDNMTYAKAQLDHARQKEKDCFENFERAHNQVVTIISRLVRANNSTVSRSTDELEDDADTSSLGLVPRVRSRRLRAPTRANASPSRRVARLSRIRATAPVPGSARVLSDHVIQALARRAGGDASLKALMRTVATSHATQSQLRAFQKAIDEVTATLNGNIAQAASLETSSKKAQVIAKEYARNFLICTYLCFSIKVSPSAQRNNIASRQVLDYEIQKKQRISKTK
jgi:hypothetical protein